MNQTGEGGQWWYYLSGGEYGYDWTKTQSFTSGLPIHIQTLVGTDKMLGDYVHSSIVDEGGERGAVLRMVNVKDDPDFTAISRNQLYTAQLTGYDASFHEFKFKIPSSLANSLRGSGGDWLDFVEVWRVGSNRLSLYVIYVPSRDEHIFQLKLWDDSVSPPRSLWSVDADLAIAWDTWNTLSFLVETTGPADGLVKVLVNGNQIFDETRVLGYPVRNINFFKLYVGPLSMARDKVEMYFDDLIIYKKM